MKIQKIFLGAVWLFFQLDSSNYRFLLKYIHRENVEFHIVGEGSLARKWGDDGLTTNFRFPQIWRILLSPRAIRDFGSVMPMGM